MSKAWIGVIAVGIVLFAVATKPSQADFESEVNSAFMEARNSTWNSGNFEGWLGAATADNLKTGRYTDQIIMSKYDVLIGDQIVAQCSGMLGTINCA
jgi:hypothetical protein